MRKKPTRTPEQLRLGMLYYVSFMHGRKRIPWEPGILLRHRSSEVLYSPREETREAFEYLEREGLIELQPIYVITPKGSERLNENFKRADRAYRRAKKLAASVTLKPKKAATKRHAKAKGSSG